MFVDVLVLMSALNKLSCFVYKTETILHREL